MGDLNRYNKAAGSDYINPSENAYFNKSSAKGARQNIPSSFST